MPSQTKKIEFNHQIDKQISVGRILKLFIASISARDICLLPHAIFFFDDADGISNLDTKQLL